MTHSDHLRKERKHLYVNECVWLKEIFETP